VVLGDFVDKVSLSLAELNRVDQTQAISVDEAFSENAVMTTATEELRP